MTKEFIKEIKQVKYFSMAAFSNYIDGVADMDNKIALACEYLISYENNGDWPIDSAINIARMKLADAVASYKKLEEKNEKIEISNEELAEKQPKIDLKKFGKVINNKNYDSFMSDPITYVSKYRAIRLKELNDKLEKNGILSPDETKKFDLINKNLTAMANIRNNLNFNERKLNYVHINDRLNAKFGSIDALKSAYDETKPSFFSKLFNTTSIEGKNLITAYKGFSDPNNPLYGKKDTIERAATRYLKHLFPNFDKDYPLPDKHLIDGLTGTQKARAILSKSILEAVRQEKEIIEEYNTAINKEGFTFDLNLDTLDVKKTNVIDLDKDLDESLINSEDDLNQDNNISMEKENNI